MARNRTQPQAPVVDDTEEMLDDEDLIDADGDEDTDEAPTEETRGTRPVDLAKQLNVNPKSLRAYLRRQYDRGEAFGTTWYLNEDQVADVTRHFTPQEVEEVEDDETAEVEA